jgi:hypothetical protein
VGVLRGFAAATTSATAAVATAQPAWHRCSAAPAVAATKPIYTGGSRRVTATTTFSAGHGVSAALPTGQGAPVTTEPTT